MSCNTSYGDGFTDGEEVEIEIAVEVPIAVDGVENGRRGRSVGLFRCELATGPGGACEGFSDGESVVGIEVVEAEGAGTG